MVLIINTVLSTYVRLLFIHHGEVKSHKWTLLKQVYEDKGGGGGHVVDKYRLKPIKISVKAW